MRCERLRQYGNYANHRQRGSAAGKRLALSVYSLANIAGQRLALNAWCVANTAGQRLALIAWCVAKTAGQRLTVTVGVWPTLQASGLI